MSSQPGIPAVKFKCIHCGAMLNVPAEQAGSTIPCTGCDAQVRVPSKSASALNTAVASEFEVVTAKPAPAAAAPAALNTSVPLTTTTQNFTSVDASTLDMSGAGESKDPTVTATVGERPTFQVASQPEPEARPYAARKKAAPPPPSSRKGVVFAGVVVFLGVSAGVGISVSNGLERKRIQDDVTALITKAQTTYTDSNVDEAAKLALDAQQKIKTSPQTLDAEMVKKWNKRIELFQQMKGEVEQAQKIFSEADANLTIARSRLEGKKSLLGNETDDNRPVIAKINALLGDVEKLEKQKKLDKIKADLAGVNKLYLEGKIEESADRAQKLVKEMDISPKVQDQEVESRADVLRKRAEQLKTARGIRMAANKDFKEAKRKIQAQLDGIDEANEDLKPLAAAVAAIKKELLDEEKKSRKISPDESAELTNIARNLSLRDQSIKATPVEGDTVGLELEGKRMRLGIQRTALNRAVFIEAGGNRLQVDADQLTGAKSRAGRVLRHALAVGEAMQKAGIASDDIWNAGEEAPLPSARRTGDDGKEYVFLHDRLYVGKPLGKGESEREAEDKFKKAAEALAVAVEKDAPTSEEIRRVVAFGLRATIKEADWYDHLRGEFVRNVVAQGYVESNMPGAADRLKKELADYREAYAKISNPVPNFSGNSATGDAAVEMRTFEDHAVWQIYDKASDTTTFAIKNPDDEKDSLFILYDFAGKLSEFPEDATPKKVRMTHQSVGVTASYDPAAEKMDYDATKWNLAAALEAPAYPAEYAAQKGFGTPGWALPPHVLLVDTKGHTKSIVTPHGKLDIQDFSTFTDAARRTDQMEKFLTQMAKVLPSAGYLHLYFRYFHNYILDSPITSRPNLLGSRAHCGDMHQTAYQSLERLMGGRYVGDCDDLAEFFMNVTRRQNKLSYVMALPQHAACGWVERAHPDSEYTFYIIDTGPPRMFMHKNLEKVIELACRAYDDDKTMRFDPKSLGFLFRFNGEPTRTPYYLSSRMYIDRDYGEAMELVQSYWHFHFYALGIQSMLEMINKGDKVPENCVELAGLYGQVKETEESIKWTQEALKQFGPEDRASRYSEEFRIGLMFREEKDNEKAFNAVKNMINELKQLQADPQWFNYTSMRLQTMGLLVSIDRPFDAWDLVQHDIFQFARRGALRIEHVGGLTGVYKEMADLVRAGKELSAAEKTNMQRLEQILTFFFDKAIFAEPDDDFNSIMRKYAFLGQWYSGKYGEAKLTEELLKDGPYPDPAKPRDHRNRKDPEAEDWKWIRLSISAYAIAMGDALDLDDPPEKWRKDDAVKLTDAMLKAAEQAKKFGSLASSEFALLSSRAFRAFLVKDWKDLEKVMVEVKERDWARLTSDIAETLGRGARFVTPEEFATQFRMFAKYVKARTSYFTVVYEAYRADAIPQALAASKVALECWPGDKDMAREAKYLGELAAKKMAKQKAEPKK